MIAFDHEVYYYINVITDIFSCYQYICEKYLFFNFIQDYVKIVYILLFITKYSTFLLNVIYIKIFTIYYSKQ